VPKKPRKTRPSRKTHQLRSNSVDTRRRDTGDPAADNPRHTADAFPVVGIGASAGGLDASKKLFTAAELYQQMIGQLPAGAVLREDGRLTMNGAAEVITGYRRDELPSVEAWCAALHGRDAETARPRYELGASPAHIAEPIAFAMVRKDGQVRHVNITMCRLDATHQLWMLLDMTERDRAEAALRRSEDYLRSILTTAVDAIVTIDGRGTIETFNSAAECLFGYTASEVVGRNVRLLMPQPYRDEHDGYLARFAKTGEARIIGIGREVVGLRKDGTTFPLDLAVSQINSSPRFTGILRDLTDRRKLEWRLAEIQTEERRRIAQELHDGIGGHITGVGLLAQTLKTQLTSAQSPLAIKADDLVNSITECQRQLHAVARELMPVEPVPEGLTAALEELATQAETRYGISCRFQCDGPVLLHDPIAAKHVFRIVQEAVHNAARHGKPKQITIGLLPTDRRLQITVTDDGTGLKEGAGTQAGMGLDNMRQRARLLGGDFAIHPKEGGGTVVMCWIPWPSTATIPHADMPTGKR